MVNRGIGWTAIALFLLSNHAARAQPGAPAPAATRCVTVTTPGRLWAGQSFTHEIGIGLEVRLSWDRLRSWDISVGPQGSSTDYLWVVSPPFRTAPHRQIGEGYNVTAAQSARISPRTFRFVTTAEQYQQAAELAAKAERDATGAITVRDIERQGKGTLELWVTGFGTSDAGDALTWIAVRIRACQPR